MKCGTAPLDQEGAKCAPRVRTGRSIFSHPASRKRGPQARAGRLSRARRWSDPKPVLEISRPRPEDWMSQVRKHTKGGPFRSPPSPADNSRFGLVDVLV